MLRAKLESAFGERIHSPFTDLDKRVWKRASTGIAALDKATAGGVPRGAITEVIGGLSSGKTGIALSILAEATGRGEMCALVDGGDAFDPASGASSGIDLDRLLWVRCSLFDQTMRSTDLLLQAGGFGVVAVDLSDLPQHAVNSAPFAAWFRFQRAIEHTPTILLLIGRGSVAKSAATLVLHTRMKQADWSGPAHGPSHGILFSGQQLEMDIARARHFSNLKPVSHHVRFYPCA
jgi:recombination protein RecA